MTPDTGRAWPPRIMRTSIHPTPPALGQSKEELLDEAEFGKDGKLHGVVLDWGGNAKIPSWDNTILGNIKISGRTLVAEVNSENHLLRDPEARSRIQEMIRRQVEEWVYQKIPALGGRTPWQAIGDPDGREIVESLLLGWERRAEEGAYRPGIRPDFDAVRNLLNLQP
jgi:Protein of unknown function (DUF2384)